MRDTPSALLRGNSLALKGRKIFAVLAGLSVKLGEKIAKENQHSLLDDINL